jgi:ribonuclease-3
LLGFFRKQSAEERNLFSSIRGIVGKRPKNFELYKLALRHSSVSDHSNERLEFLGDAILGAVVADFLFKKFPYKNEGFLTELRSRLVKRESLNSLSEKIGLRKLLFINPKSTGVSISAYGNALEAFVGAIYLDHGYKFCYKFIINRLIHPYLDIQDVIEENRNFKSALIEWAQKMGHQIEFKITDEEGERHNKSFVSIVLLNCEEVGKGIGSSKKKAEQKAAEKACVKLEVYKNLE